MSVSFFQRRAPGEPVRPILQRALDRHGLSRRLERRISTELWAQAVGAEIASRAQPTVLSCGVLHLLVQDHRWRDQLDAARSLIIERVNHRLGGAHVRELRFGLAHEGALTPRVDAAERPTPPSVHVLGTVELEPQLREAVLRAAEAALRKRAARA